MIIPVLLSSQAWLFIQLWYLPFAPCLLSFMSLLSHYIVSLINSSMDLEGVETVLSALGIAHAQACDSQRQDDV